MEPGVDGRDRVAVVHRDGAGPSAGSQGALQVGEHVRLGRESRESPLALERFREPLQVATRVGEIGLAHLDVVEPHDRVDLDRMRVGLLAHHLAVQLALGRHVDDEIAADLRVAAEPPIVRQARGGRGTASRAR